MLKSAFSIIDQLFQKEITRAEKRRYKNCCKCSECCVKNQNNYDDENKFVSFILDPFQEWKPDIEINMIMTKKNYIIVYILKTKIICYIL